MPTPSSAAGGTPADKQAAIAEADVQSRMAREREQLIRDTAFCSMLCPVGHASKRKDDGKDTTHDGDVSEAKTAPPVSFCGSKGLFRFADSLDILLYAVAFVCSAGVGVLIPLFAVVFGGMLDNLNSPDPNAVTTSMNTVALQFLYIAIGAGFCTWMQIALPTIAAERQALRMRAAYADAVLRQEPGWFETEQDPAEISSLLVDSSVQVVNGAGKSLGIAVQASVTTIAGLTIGFVASWDLSLVVLAVMPFFALPVMVITNSKAISEKANADAYARAQSVASESLSNIRTVRAFSGKEAESRRYEDHLSLAETVTIRASRALGLGMGALWLFMLGSYAVAMAYGASRIRDTRAANPLCAVTFVASGPTADCFTPGNFMEAFFALIIGGSTLGQIAPAIGTVSAALASAARVYATVDRVSAIDSSSDAGLKPDEKPTGRIEFRGVTFAFPSNPDRQVLKGFSIVIEPGTTLALVGESGSGKSTIVQLLMRFYDPQEGSILLDGKDIREYNVAWLRAQMGLVSQEPSLFSTSIEENIALGLPSYTSNFGEVSEDTVPWSDLSDSDRSSREAIRSGTGRLWFNAEISNGRTVDDLPALPPAIRRRVIEAAKAASADFFITILPREYRTRVGDRGGQLSGGQKQRVAIARALVRKPAIFIGDEATSALDSRSEREVVAAMNRLLAESGDLTSIIIAHRLSTVTRADKIVVLDRGVVVETGTHAELMLAGGVYHGLASSQGLTAEDGAAAGRGRAASDRALPSGGGGGELAAPRANEELEVIERRVAARLAVPEAELPALDRLFFALLKDATRSALVKADQEAALTALDSRLTGMKAFLAINEPRAVLLQSAFLEMSPSEKRWLITWWLGLKPAELAEAEAQVVASGVEPAVGALLKGKTAALRAETQAMVKAARKAKKPVWEIAPEAKAMSLHIPPCRSRNEMLRLVLAASRPDIPMARILSYQRPERLLMVLAVLAAAGSGAILPMYALGLSDMLEVLYRTGQAFEDGVLFYAIFFLVVGAVALVANWAMNTLFVTLGARLTTRLRRLAFRAMLRQEVGFFDYEMNAVGTLTGRLAGDAALVRAATGEKLGVTVASLVSLVAGLVIAFTASWRLSLIVLALGPLLAFSAMMEQAVFEGFGGASKEALETGARILDEAARSNRTVAGLGAQKHLAASFRRSLEGPSREAIAMGLWGGAAAGLGNLINYGSFGLIFWVGSRFVVDGFITVGAIFRAFFGLSFGLSGGAALSTAAADVGKAGNATKSIFSIIDREPRMADGSEGAALTSVTSSSPPGGAAPLAPASAVVPSRAAPARASAGGAPAGPGRIEFKNVTFSYPARPEAVALRNFSAVLEAGSTVGLVGPSGSGKSTIVQLLMRFYDPDEGTILLDGKDIREYDVSELRDRIGLVGQEPALFSDTIHYNIAYGRRGGLPSKPLPDLGLGTDTHPSVTECRGAVEDAARSAFAHGFIEERLPLGYSTFAGVQGSSRLSGGQKQRVAIARSLVRKPGFLIGDEVTSALDSQSEKEVQRALDTMLAEAKRSSLDRTSVFVAHRLSTIRAADQILVLQGGKLKERGTHDALMAMGGLYAGLARAQQMAGARAASSEEDDEAAAAAPAAAAAAGTE